jgi:hypothetical protein
MFKKSLSHQYPLMRDPQRNPKCYEFTDQERKEASQRVDQLLRERVTKHATKLQGE